MWVLLVTWFVFNQPPATSQSTFNSKQACLIARDAIQAEQKRLKAEQEEFDARRGTTPSVPPRVSAVCAPK